VSTTLVVASSPTSFLRPRWRALRRALTFSKTIVVGNSSWYIYSNADFLVAGRLLGVNALGIYSFGWNLISVALEKVSTLINALTPAYFSALQKDPQGMQRMLLGVTEALALLLFPATVGIALVAPDLVPVVFGTKWTTAVPVIQVLAICNAMRVLGPVVSNVLMNAGSERFMMWMGVSSAVIFPLGFLLASRFGPVGIAAAWLVLYPATAAVIYWRLFKRGITSGLAYFSAIWPAASSTGIMAIAVSLARHALIDESAVWRLAATVSIGAAVYPLTLWFGYRSRIDRFVRAVLRARRGTPATTVV
jgi:PST family polysaccharide transporter